MRGRPKKYTERQRYMISVLTLHGLAPSAIVTVMGRYGVPMTEKAAWRQVASTPYRRDETVVIRQRHLDRLKLHRLDRNHGQPGLPDTFFIARPA